jgi:DNA-binding NtrC family response regulator
MAMPKILVIDDDPAVCEVITDCLQEWAGTAVDCALNGMLGAQKLQQGHFDLALIDGVLPTVSGLQLAEIAANENTPVLLLSGHPDYTEKFHSFGYPYLAKPFSLDQLLSESRRVIAETSENIRCVKASAARMQASAEALTAAIEESKQLLDKIKGDKGTP